MIRDRTEPAIEALAAVLAAVPAALILWSGVDVLAPPAPVAAPRVTVALTMQPDPAPAATPAPPPQLPPAAASVQQLVTASAPVPVHLPTVPKAPRPVRHHAVAVTAPALTENVTPATHAPPAPAAQAAPHVADPSADALYTGLVHQAVERHKRNPDTAAYRLLHPAGKVAVVFTIARSGAVSDVQVVASSGADMLDRQAITIVAGCAFPAMPPAAFAGVATHRFQMQITFPPPYHED
jgi:protein TonB